jgi:hypothetical protein
MPIIGLGLLIGGSGPFHVVDKVPYKKMANLADAPSPATLYSLIIGLGFCSLVGALQPSPALL